MKEFVVYTAARLVVFAVVFAVVLGLWLLVTDGPVQVLWPLLLAAVLSTAASAVVLKDLRARFAARVHERADRMATRPRE